MWWWWAAALATTPVTWESVTTEALDAWESGPGAAWVPREEAAREASRRVPVGPTSVRAEAQLGLSGQEQLLTAVELPLSVGTRERRRWKALADATKAEADWARWEWVQEVHVAWLQWWTASEVAEHLQAYADDVEHDLARFEQAVDDGLLAPLALEDLRAESLQVHAEAAAMEQQATVASARVRGLLGPCTLDPGDHALHDVPPDAPNPWEGLGTRAEELPQVRAPLARAEAERRRAKALGAARLPSIEGGPMWAPDAQGELRALAFVGVSVPLQPGIASSRREALGAAAAAEGEAQWRARERAAHLEEEALAYDASARRLQRLQEEVLGPLTVRQERLEAALAEGLVTADRVVRARRERHEAEHEVVLVAGELLAGAARAEAVRAVIEGE